MKIGLCSTMSCGKTTLVKELAKLPKFKDYHIATERSKYLKDLGIPLNTDSSLNGQFIFAAERSSELLHENLLTDRTIIDVMAFTLSSSTIKWPARRELTEAMANLLPQYDYIFYIDTEGTTIEDNGIRTIDPIYREKIDKVIIGLLEEYKPNYYKISGPTEDRIKSILEVIG